MLKTAATVLAWVGLSLAVVGYSFGQSQQPPPSEGKSGRPQQSQSQSAQQQPADNQRGTEQAPLVVKVLPAPKTNEETAQEAKDRSEKAANDRELVIYSRDLDILTAILIAVGLLQLFVFGYQALKLRQTVKTMEDTAERQLRAYVFITDGNISIDPTTFRIFIKLRNSAQTPGYEFSTWLGGGIYRDDDSPFPLDTKPLGERSVASIIGPGETVDIDSRNSSISQEEISAIIDEYLAIFVWGGCDYTDTFGKRWSFVFRMKVSSPAMSAEGGVLVWGLKPAAIGYTETEIQNWN